MRQRKTNQPRVSAALQRLYGYRLFEGRVRDEVRDWLTGAAETAHSNDALAAVMLEELRARKGVAGLIDGDAGRASITRPAVLAYRCGSGRR
jgi:hypothetical protein